MRRLFSSLGVAAALLLPATAQAQVHASGYAAGGIAGYSAFFGSRSPLVFAAGGAEVVAEPGLGAATEVGVLTGASSGVLGIFSINGVGRVHVPAVAFTPFVTAGYTNASSFEVGFKAWNIGGGVLCFGRERPRWRFEFRDHVRPDSRGTSHYWVLRAGIHFP